MKLREYILGALALVSPAIGIALVGFVCGGCVYKGGKVVDGTNLCIGMTIPGTEWTINALDYISGVRVAGNDMTCITVTNRVKETNSYFGVVSTSRDTEMTARIEPCESECPTNVCTCAE